MDARQGPEWFQITVCATGDTHAYDTAHMLDRNYLPPSWIARGQQLVSQADYEEMVTFDRAVANGASVDAIRKFYRL